MKEKFKYGGRSAKDIKARAQRVASGGFDRFIKSDIPRFKVSDGDNSIRLLPYTWKNTEKWGNHWGIDVAIHRNIGVDDSSFPCLAMKGKDCPLCDARNEMAREEGDHPKYKRKGDDRVERPSDKIKARAGTLVYLIDRNDEKAGPSWWLMPKTVEKEITHRSTHKKTGEALLVDHPKKGYDITFEKEGKGLKTKYVGVDVDRDPSPISDNPKRMERFLDIITESPLPSILEFSTAEHMEKVYMGKKAKERDDDDEDENEEEDEDEDDNDDDDDVKKKKKKSKKKSKSDDDDDDDNNDDDDEDEDDSKSKKKKKKKSKSDDDDEDEDEEDDDDEDDDSSKKSKKKKKKSKSDDDDDDEDEEDDDDDDVKKKKKKSKSKDDDDDEDEDEDEDEEDDDDDEDSGKKNKAKKSVERMKKKKKK